MKIELSEDVYSEVRRLCDLFSVSEDVLIRRLLKLPDASTAGSPVGTSLPPMQGSRPKGSEGYLTRDGIRLPYLLELRKNFKGSEYRAKVCPDGILVDGFNGYFTSPSLAAMHITKYNVNGWRFWEYKDLDTQKWRLLDELR